VKKGYGPLDYESKDDLLLPSLQRTGQWVADGYVRSLSKDPENGF
jgi:hypothetical protein